jgi:DNA invertase Pin-like site-specific DNA recombinase
MKNQINGQRIGYARVSTVGQSLDIQIERLGAADCGRIFQETATGGRGERPELEKALDYIREGDTFIVTRLDRLARSMHDLTRSAVLLEKKKVNLVVLDQDIDTGSATGRLLFNLLGTIAEFERELINERTAEGRARAMAAGVKFGAKELLSEKEKLALIVDCEQGQLTKSAIGKKYGISRASVYRILNNKQTGRDHRY